MDKYVVSWIETHKITVRALDAQRAKIEALMIAGKNATSTCQDRGMYAATSVDHDDPPPTRKD